MLGILPSQDLRTPFQPVSEVFGKVRYMSAGGLERKTKPEQYVEKVAASD